MLQALRPVSRFEDTKESHNVLAGSIAYHDGVVVESLEDGGFDVLRHRYRRGQDESGIVL